MLLNRSEAVPSQVEPDLCVVCDPAQRDAAGCRGAPHSAPKLKRSLDRGQIELAYPLQVDALASYPKIVRV